MGIGALGKPLRVGMPAIGGLGAQGNNGNMNDMVMASLMSRRAPGARRTAGAGAKKPSVAAPTGRPGGPGGPGGLAIPGGMSDLERRFIQGPAGRSLQANFNNGTGAFAPKTTSGVNQPDALAKAMAALGMTPNVEAEVPVVANSASDGGRDRGGEDGGGPGAGEPDTGQGGAGYGIDPADDPPPRTPPRRTTGQIGDGSPPMDPSDPSDPSDEGPSLEDDPYSIDPEADMFAKMVYDILMGGAGKGDYTEAFNPLRTSMEEQVQRAQADTLEQFGNMGAQYGSGSVEGVGEVGRRGAQDINTILGNMAYGADEANRNRMIQGAMQLGNQLYGSQEGAANREMQLLQALLNSQTAGTGQLGEYGEFMQGVDQAALDREFQDWLRTEMGWTDEMLAFLGTPMQSSGPYYESGAWDQFAPMFAAFMQSGAFSGSGGSGGAGGGGSIDWGNWFGPPTTP